MGSTKKTEAEQQIVPFSGNVHQRLLEARVRFLEAGAKKSGKNMKLEFTYFELADIVPIATRIFKEVGLLHTLNIVGDVAKMRFYNVDDPEDELDFTCPFVQNDPIISNAGKEVTNKLQSLGASITYIRRYLYQMALDIIEQDEVDGMLGMAPAEDTASIRPATPAQREEIKQTLTATAAPADELQITALKTALKRLLELDPEKEEFANTIAVQTDGFTDLTREDCAALIDGIAKMLEGYTDEAH